MTPVITMEIVKVTDEVIRYYANPVLGGTGVVGHLISVYVFMSHRHHPMATLLLALSFSDVAFLLLSFVDLVDFLWTSVDPVAGRNFSVVALAHTPWLRLLLSRVTGLLTAAIAVERCVVVCLPMTSRGRVTPGARHAWVGLIYVITSAAHVPLFLRNKVTWVTLQAEKVGQMVNVCTAALHETEFSVTQAHWLNLYKDLLLNVVFRLAPVIAVTVSSIFTWTCLARARLWRHAAAVGGNSNGLESRSVRERRLTVTLLCLCSVFLATSLPAVVAFIVRIFVPDFDYYGAYYNSFQICATVTNHLAVWNSTANFFIYAFTSRWFARALKADVCSRRFKVKRQIMKPMSVCNTSS